MSRRDVGLTVKKAALLKRREPEDKPIKVCSRHVILFAQGVLMQVLSDGVPTKSKELVQSMMSAGRLGS